MRRNAAIKLNIAAGLIDTHGRRFHNLGMSIKLNEPVSKLMETLSTSRGAKSWRERRHLLETRTLSLSEISTVLALAAHFKKERAHKKAPLTVLAERSIAQVFWENSTRTRSSFELAGRKLGATVLNLDVKTSSVAKGETLEDTALNLHAMGIDAIVMRHTQSGAPGDLAHLCGDKVNVVNAGDGWHAHPSQGLLDLFSMLEATDALPSFENDLHEKSMAGKKVAIIGDITHSRVARSNLFLLKKLGAEVHFAGPPALVPEEFAAPELGAIVHHNLEPALKNADFVISLRLQLERQAQGLIASLDEYRHFYRLDHHRLAIASPGVRVMHPGPINRGLEITAALADDPKLSLVLHQVENGVLSRMAVLALLLAPEQN